MGRPPTTRRSFLVALASSALASAQSPSTGRPFRIGVIANHVPRQHLELAEASPFSGSAEFVMGLRELGWEEGRNIRLVWRSAEGRRDRYPPIVSELIHMPVDVIVGGDEGAVATMRGSRTIPVVAYSIDNPVESGYAKSLARPGGNLTGIANTGGAEAGKALALLKEALPRARRFGLLAQSLEQADSFPGLSPKSPLAVAGRMLGVDLFFLTFGDPRSLPELVRSASRQGADALLVDSTYAIHYHRENRDALNRSAIKHRLPVMHLSLVAAADGALMAFGYDLTERWRRASYFVDRILRGANPGDLPIEHSRRVQFHVNLKAARAISLKIPSPVLLQADRVFD